MNKLLAFTNCSETKAEAIASAKQHVELDMLRQGTYGDDKGHGCSIGCHYGGNNHAAAPAKHGFSIPFVYLCDRIFEAQPDIKSAQEFHVWVMENVPEGGDTMRIWWEFFALTVEGIGPEWNDFAAECRTYDPDIERLCALSLSIPIPISLSLSFDRVRDTDLARDCALSLALHLSRDRALDTENFKKAVLKFANT